MYTRNNKIAKKNMVELKEKLDKSMLVVGGFNNPLSASNTTIIYKNYLRYRKTQWHWIKKYLFTYMEHSSQQWNTVFFFQVLIEDLPRDHVLGHQQVLKNGNHTNHVLQT